MAEIVPIRRKTLPNPSINSSLRGTFRGDLSLESGFHPEVQLQCRNILREMLLLEQMSIQLGMSPSRAKTQEGGGGYCTTCYQDFPHRGSDRLYKFYPALLRILEGYHFTTSECFYHLHSLKRYRMPCQCYGFYNNVCNHCIGGSMVHK